MGFLQYLRRHKALTNQADKPESKRTLLLELVEAQAELAYLKKAPLSNWRPSVLNGQMSNYSVDQRDNSIAEAKAEIARLKAKIKGSDLVLVRRKPPQTHTKSAPTNTHTSKGGLG